MCDLSNFLAYISTIKVLNKFICIYVQDVFLIFYLSPFFSSLFGVSLLYCQYKLEVLFYKNKHIIWCSSFVSYRYWVVWLSDSQCTKFYMYCDHKWLCSTAQLCSQNFCCNVCPQFWCNMPKSLMSYAHS